jgi:hypothetical protein
MKLKDPSEKRGKSRKNGNIDDQVNVPVLGECVKVESFIEPQAGVSGE